jgi:hypothetical protein
MRQAQFVFWFGWFHGIFLILLVNRIPFGNELIFSVQINGLSIIPAIWYERATNIWRNYGNSMKFICG